MNKVVVTNSLLINADPERVWDYSQNWRKRHEWDGSVVGAKYLSETSPIEVQVKGAGGIEFKVTYKLSNRPKLTTLVMSDLHSFWIKGGGGSWKYELAEGKTLWTQHNALILRDGILGRMFRPIFFFILSMTTRRSMRRAKAEIENFR
jgi:hypothetical protein